MLPQARTDFFGIDRRFSGHGPGGHPSGLAEGLDGVEKGVGLGGQIAFEDGLAFGAEDAHEHGPGMQIDAGIELVWLVKIRHVGLAPRLVNGIVRSVAGDGHHEHLKSTCVFDGPCH